MTCYMQDMYVDSMFCDQGEIWFVGTNDSILYKIDGNREIYPMKMIPHEKDKRFRNSAICYKEENKIYCFPERGKNICIFDIEKNILNEIKLDDNEERLSVYNEWFIDEYIWCVSFTSNKLYMINKECHKIEKNFIIPYNCSKPDIQATCYEKNIYFVSNESTTILEFSTETKKFREYCIKCEEKGFSTIVANEENLFITGSKCKLYVYNLTSKELETIDLEAFIKFEIKEKSYEENIFYRSILLNGYIVLSTENISQLISNQIIICNLEKKEINVLTFKDNCERRAGDFFVISKYCDCEIIIYDNWNRTMYLYDLDKQKLERQMIQVGKLITNSFVNDIKNVDCNKENNIVDLRKFLEIFNE